MRKEKIKLLCFLMIMLASLIGCQESSSSGSSSDKSSQLDASGDASSDALSVKPGNDTSDNVTGSDNESKGVEPKDDTANGSKTLPLSQSTSESTTSSNTTTSNQNSGDLTALTDLKASLTGVVLDDQGSPIAQAGVSVFGKSTKTDTQGNWSIAEIPVSQVDIAPLSHTATTQDARNVILSTVPVSVVKDGYLSATVYVGSTAVIYDQDTLGQLGNIKDLGNAVALSQLPSGNTLVVSGLAGTSGDVILKKKDKTVTGVLRSEVTGYALPNVPLSFYVKAADVDNVKGGNASGTAACGGTCSEVVDNGHIPGKVTYGYTEIVVSTDDSGRFTFANVAEGTYVLNSASSAWNLKYSTEIAVPGNKKLINVTDVSAVPVISLDSVAPYVMAVTGGSVQNNLIQVDTSVNLNQTPLEFVFNENLQPSRFDANQSLMIHDQDGNYYPIKTQKSLNALKAVGGDASGDSATQAAEELTQLTNNRLKIYTLIPVPEGATLTVSLKTYDYIDTALNPNVLVKKQITLVNNYTPSDSTDGYFLEYKVRLYGGAPYVLGFQNTGFNASNKLMLLQNVDFLNTPLEIVFNEPLQISSNKLAQALTIIDGAGNSYAIDTAKTKFQENTLKLYTTTSPTSAVFLNLFLNKAILVDEVGLPLMHPSSLALRFPSKTGVSATPVGEAQEYVLFTMDLTGSAPYVQGVLSAQVDLAQPPMLLLQEQIDFVTTPLILKFSKPLNTTGFNLNASLRLIDEKGVGYILDPSDGKSSLSGDTLTLYTATTPPDTAVLTLQLLKSSFMDTSNRSNALIASALAFPFDPTQMAANNPLGQYTPEGVSASNQYVTLRLKRGGAAPFIQAIRNAEGIDNDIHLSQNVDMVTLPLQIIFSENINTEGFDLADAIRVYGTKTVYPVSVDASSDASTLSGNILTIYTEESPTIEPEFTVSLKRSAFQDAIGNKLNGAKSITNIDVTPIQTEEFVTLTIKRGNFTPVIEGFLNASGVDTNGDGVKDAILLAESVDLITTPLKINFSENMVVTNLASSVRLMDQNGIQAYPLEMGADKTAMNGNVLSLYSTKAPKEGAIFTIQLTVASFKNSWGVPLDVGTSTVPKNLKYPVVSGFQPSVSGEDLQVTVTLKMKRGGMAPYLVGLSNVSGVDTDGNGVADAIQLDEGVDLVSTPLELIFSEAVVISSLSDAITLIDENGSMAYPLDTGSGKTAVSGKTLSLYSTIAPLEGRKVKVVLKPAMIKDSSGNSLDVGTSSSPRALQYPVVSGSAPVVSGDSTQTLVTLMIKRGGMAPYIVGIRDAFRLDTTGNGIADATQLADAIDLVNAPLQIVFSEPVSSSSLSDAIVVYDNSDSEGEGYVLDMSSGKTAISGNVLNIYTTTAPQEGRTFIVRLASSMFKDSSGNLLNIGKVGTPKALEFPSGVTTTVSNSNMTNYVNLTLKRTGMSPGVEGIANATYGATRLTIKAPVDFSATPLKVVFSETINNATFTAGSDIVLVVEGEQYSIDTSSGKTALNGNVLSIYALGNVPEGEEIELSLKLFGFQDSVGNSLLSTGSLVFPSNQGYYSTSNRDGFLVIKLVREISAPFVAGIKNATYSNATTSQLDDSVDLSTSNPLKVVFSESVSNSFLGSSIFVSDSNGQSYTLDTSNTTLVGDTLSIVTRTVPPEGSTLTVKLLVSVFKDTDSHELIGGKTMLFPLNSTHLLGITPTSSGDFLSLTLKRGGAEPYVLGVRNATFTGSVLQLDDTVDFTSTGIQVVFSESMKTSGFNGSTSIILVDAKDSTKALLIDSTNTAMSGSILTIRTTNAPAPGATLNLLLKKSDFKDLAQNSLKNINGVLLFPASYTPAEVTKNGEEYLKIVLLSKADTAPYVVGVKNASYSNGVPTQLRLGDAVDFSSANPMQIVFNETLSTANFNARTSLVVLDTTSGNVNKVYETSGSALSGNTLSVVLGATPPQDAVLKILLKSTDFTDTAALPNALETSSIPSLAYPEDNGNNYTPTKTDSQDGNTVFSYVTLKVALSEGAPFVVGVRNASFVDLDSNSTPESIQLDNSITLNTAPLQLEFNENINAISNLATAISIVDQAGITYSVDTSTGKSNLSGNLLSIYTTATPPTNAVLRIRLSRSDFRDSATFAHELTADKLSYPLEGATTYTPTLAEGNRVELKLYMSGAATPTTPNIIVQQVDSQSTTGDYRIQGLSVSGLLDYDENINGTIAQMNSSAASTSRLGALAQAIAVADATNYTNWTEASVSTNVGYLKLHNTEAGRTYTLTVSGSTPSRISIDTALANVSTSGQGATEVTDVVSANFTGVDNQELHVWIEGVVPGNEVKITTKNFSDNETVASFELKDVAPPMVAVQSVNASDFIQEGYSISAITESHVPGENDETGNAAVSDTTALFPTLALTSSLYDQLNRRHSSSIANTVPLLAGESGRTLSSGRNDEIYTQADYNAWATPLQKLVGTVLTDRANSTTLTVNSVSGFAVSDVVVLDDINVGRITAATAGSKTITVISNVTLEKGTTLYKAAPVPVTTVVWATPATTSFDVPSAIGFSVGNVIMVDDELTTILAITHGHAIALVGAAPTGPAVGNIVQRLSVDVSTVAELRSGSVSSGKTVNVLSVSGFSIGKMVRFGIQNKFYTIQSINESNRTLTVLQTITAPVDGDAMTQLSPVANASSTLTAYSTASNTLSLASTAEFQDGDILLIAAKYLVEIDTISSKLSMTVNTLNSAPEVGDVIQKYSPTNVSATLTADVSASKTLNVDSIAAFADGDILISATGLIGIINGDPVSSNSTLTLASPLGIFDAGSTVKAYNLTDEAALQEAVSMGETQLKIPFVEKSEFAANDLIAFCSAGEDSDCASTELNNDQVYTIQSVATDTDPTKALITLTAPLLAPQSATIDFVVQLERKTTAATRAIDLEVTEPLTITSTAAATVRGNSDLTIKNTTTGVTTVDAGVNASILVKLGDWRTINNNSLLSIKDLADLSGNSAQADAGVVIKDKTPPLATQATASGNVLTLVFDQAIELVGGTTLIVKDTDNTPEYTFTFTNGDGGRFGSATVNGVAYTSPEGYVISATAATLVVDPNGSNVSGTTSNVPVSAVLSNSNKTLTLTANSPEDSSENALMDMEGYFSPLSIVDANDTVAYIVDWSTAISDEAANTWNVVTTTANGNGASAAAQNDAYYCASAGPCKNPMISGTDSTVPLLKPVTQLKQCVDGNGDAATCMVSSASATTRLHLDASNDVSDGKWGVGDRVKGETYEIFITFSEEVTAGTITAEPFDSTSSTKATYSAVTVTALNGTTAIYKLTFSLTGGVVVAGDKLTLKDWSDKGLGKVMAINSLVENGQTNVVSARLTLTSETTLTVTNADILVVRSGTTVTSLDDSTPEPTIDSTAQVGHSKIALNSVKGAANDGIWSVGDSGSESYTVYYNFNKRVKLDNSTVELTTPTYSGLSNDASYTPGTVTLISPYTVQATFSLVNGDVVEGDTLYLLNLKDASSDTYIGLDIDGGANGNLDMRSSKAVSAKVVLNAAGTGATLSKPTHYDDNFDNDGDATADASWNMGVELAGNYNVQTMNALNIQNDSDDVWSVGDAAGTYSFKLKFSENILCVLDSTGNCTNITDTVDLKSSLGATKLIIADKKVYPIGNNTLQVVVSTNAAAVDGDYLELTVPDYAGNSNANIRLRLGATAGAGLIIDSNAF
ncbi:hypothetical protein WDW89_19845 [Deltaproteobacteria bacterium TL4]